ncbi:unnamed protein product [Meloidogyne enterolobii]|uniref:Uncharacterized protein n=1 Tax=Meloidogyne enterolobii TaxID=390850 RepID=A0ACB0ZE04_MELEN
MNFAIMATVLKRTTLITNLLFWKMQSTTMGTLNIHPSESMTINITTISSSI